MAEKRDDMKARLAELSEERAGLDAAIEDMIVSMAQVPAEQRAALLLRDVEGFAYEEIALMTGVEIGTVKSRIHRARLAVRNTLITRGWRGSGG